MKSASENISSQPTAWVLIACALVSGCSQGPSTEAFAKVDAWIPVATANAFWTLSTDDQSTRDRKHPAPSFSGGQARITLIDAATNENHRLAWPAPYATVRQQLLAKSNDGRFFVSSYVWNDAILDNCVDSPAQCSKFVDTEPLSADEAKAKLISAPQFSPAVYKQFFGTDAPAKAGA
jgi:hypothetical protein